MHRAAQDYFWESTPEDGGEHGTVERAAAADNLGGIECAAGLFFEEVPHGGQQRRHPGGPPDHLHRGDVIQRDLRLLQRLGTDTIL